MDIVTRMCDDNEYSPRRPPIRNQVCKEMYVCQASRAGRFDFFLQDASFSRSVG